MSKGVLCSPRADTQTHTHTHTHTQTHTHTHTHTHMKVNTEDTLPGFQDFFLQPIIKDQSNCTETTTLPNCNGPLPEKKRYGGII